MNLHYKKMITSPFLSKIKHSSKVNEILLNHTLHLCIQSSSFATLPYFVYGMDSFDSIMQTNTGNCIALSLFIKHYLKTTYNIDSYLIPASIPRKYCRDGYLFISHVALAVPRNQKHVFVLDPAFYFLQALSAHLDHHLDDNEDIISSSNIYTGNEETIAYHVEQSPKVVHYNAYQTIKKGIYNVRCHYTTNVHDSWQYFLTEIINPDEAISNFFLNIIHPFLTTTIFDEHSGLHKLHVHLKYSRDGEQLTITLNNQPFFDGPPHQLSKKQYRIIKQEMGSYFDESYFSKHLPFITDIDF